MLETDGGFDREEVPFVIEGAGFVGVHEQITVEEVYFCF